MRPLIMVSVFCALTVPSGPGHASAQTDPAPSAAPAPVDRVKFDGTLNSTARPTPEPGPAVSGPAPSIVLYTMGKGAVVWQKFGHGAVCVEYAPGSGKLSLCYNYGTTDFTRPASVGWGFLRGEGKFWVSVTTPKRMIRQYMGFDRTLWRQVIPLPADKALVLAEKLAINALPENRNYTYHHFYDNCTTRIRDLLDEATDGKLRQGSAGKPGPTFREYARKGFSQDEWLLVATDFFLGHGADIRPDLWQAMFLPVYLRQVVQEQLGVVPEVIYQRRGPQLTEGDSSGRLWVVLLALLLGAPLAIARWRGRHERAALGFAGVTLFLIGFIVWFLAIVTAVDEFRYNENLLLFWPTDLALLFLSADRRMLYARIRVATVALASLLYVVGVFTQPLWSQWLLVFLPMMAVIVPLGQAASAAAGVDTKDANADAASADAKKSSSGKPDGGQSKSKSKSKSKQKRKKKKRG